MDANQGNGNPDGSQQLGGEGGSSGGASGGAAAGATAHQQPPTEVGGILQLSSAAAQAYDGFDATIHAVDKDGTPIRTASGSWAKKRGRKAGSTVTPVAQAGNSQVPTAAVVEPKIDNTVAAKMMAGMSVAGLCMLFGEDWDTDDKNEQKALVDSWRGYFEATGGMDASPATGLLFAYGAYAFGNAPKKETPRIASDGVKNAFKRFGTWISGLIRRKS